MVLDVETPNPPDLTNRGKPSEFEPSGALDSTSDLRRGELEEILRDGAWNEAFQEWAAYADLTEDEYRTVHDFGLVDRLDLYWDPDEERLRFEVPALPAELADQEALASRVTSELTDLGRTVIEMLEDAYVDWGAGETETESWSAETFGDERPLED